MESPAVPFTTDRPARSFLLTNLRSLHEHLQFCPRAQTLLGYRSTDFRLVVVALSCKTWGCPVCGRRRISRLAHQTQDAKPNRLLTLTVDPKLHANPRQAFDSTRRCVPELTRFLRKRFGSFEYLRVTELTAAGWPHYHLLVRSPYIPQPVVKNHWAFLTGAVIVDLRKVHKALDAYTYLVKYLSKLKHIDWTDRHVSMSKRFVPPDLNSKPKPDKLANVHVVHQHPYTYLLEHYTDRRFETADPGSRVQMCKDEEFEAEQLTLQLANDDDW